MKCLFLKFCHQPFTYLPDGLVVDFVPYFLMYLFTFSFAVLLSCILLYLSASFLVNFCCSTFFYFFLSYFTYASGQIVLFAVCYIFLTTKLIIILEGDTLGGGEQIKCYSIGQQDAGAF
jgi:hypothetical protein